MGLDAVELVMGLEEEFGVSIPDSETEKMITPCHIIDWMWTRHGRGALFRSPGIKPPPGFQDWTRDQVAERVREVIRDQLGVGDFSDDDGFIEDLGVG